MTEFSNTEYIYEPITLTRSEVEVECGRDITDEEWVDFVDELFGAVDYYYEHNFTLLCRDLSEGRKLGYPNPDDDDEFNDDEDNDA